MLYVIALGGNALLKRGQPLEANLLRENVKKAASVIAKVANDHQVLIVHGNGPQVGLLALQAEAYKEVHAYPLDILDAESQGMIGYLLQQEIANHANKNCVTLLTQVVVDANDPAFENPTKFIGPVYSQKQSESVAQEHAWVMKQDGEYVRRVVPSPMPKAVFELESLKALLKADMTVVAGGGGGIPCVESNGKLQGVEAVVDKDLTAALIAEKLNADHLVILTDVDAVYEDFAKPTAKAITQVSVKALEAKSFPAGSMGPKVQAAAQFTRQTGQASYIGSLALLQSILQGQSGTRIVAD